ncbi:MAG: hypothetical protein V7750_11085, partial [Sneathiella sp.]
MTRGVFFLLLMGGAALNAVIKPIENWFLNGDIVSSPSFPVTVFGLQPAVLICMCLGGYSLAVGAVKYKSEIKARDLLAATMITGLCLVPFAKVAWVAVSCCALAGLSSQDKKNFRYKAGMVILLAVGIRDPLATFVMDLMASPLLTFDAWAAGSLLHIWTGDVIISDNLIRRADGHSVFILSGCASFKNISHALLIWFAFIRMYSAKSVLYWMLSGAIITAFIFTINILRLGLMGISERSYDIIHNGIGSDVFSALTLLILF